MTPSEKSSRETAEAAMVRPSLTIRARHDELLEELASTRYASRSEAARAGIEQLAKTVLGSGETNIERLVNQVKDLNDQVESLSDQLNKIEDRSDASREASAQQPDNRSGSVDDSLTSAVDVSDSTSESAGLQDEIYNLLTSRGRLTISEIAEELDESGLDIRENLTSLIDRGFVAEVHSDQHSQYEIAEINN